MQIAQLAQALLRKTSIRKRFPPRKTPLLSDVFPDQKGGSEIREYIEKLSPSFRTIFLTVADLCSIYDSQQKPMMFSQSTIAEKTNHCRQTVNEAVRQFARDGYLSSERRYNSSCFYRLSPIFKRLDVRMALRDLIPSFKASCLALFLLIPGFVQTRPTLILNQGEIYKSSLISKTKGGQKIPQQGVMEGEKRVPRDSELFKYQSRHGCGGKSYMAEVTPLHTSIGKELSLTLAQRVKLTAIPENVLQEAINEFRGVKGVVKPFELLMKISLNHCQRMKIAPDWLKSLALAQALGFPDPKQLDTSTTPEQMQTYIQKLAQRAQLQDYQKGVNKTSSYSSPSNYPRKQESPYRAQPRTPSWKNTSWYDKQENEDSFYTKEKLTADERSLMKQQALAEYNHAQAEQRTSLILAQDQERRRQAVSLNDPELQQRLQEQAHRNPFAAILAGIK